MTTLLTYLMIFGVGVLSTNIVPTQHRALYRYWVGCLLFVSSLMFLISLCL